MLLQQLPQHRDEDVDRVGRNALRVAQQRAFGRADRRVVRAIHLRAAVDEIEEWLGGHQGGEIFTISLPCMRIGAVISASSSARRPPRAAARRRAVQQYQYEEEMYLSLDGTRDDLRQQLDRGAERAARHLVRYAAERAHRSRRGPAVLHVAGDASHARHARRAADGRQFCTSGSTSTTCGRLVRARPFAWSSYAFGTTGRARRLQAERSAGGVGVAARTGRRMERRRVRRVPPARAERRRVPQRRTGKPAPRQHPRVGAAAGRPAARAHRSSSRRGWSRSRSSTAR